jgi:cell division protease FtsH
VPIHAPKEYSEETARVIDEEVKRTLSEAHAKVKEILGVHRPALEGLAQLLLEKEVVERSELQAVLKVRSIDSAKEKKKPGEGLQRSNLEHRAE